VTVFLRKIDVHSSSMAGFQCLGCGLHMASVYVSGVLLVHATVFAMMFTAFGEILT